MSEPDDAIFTYFKADPNDPSGRLWFQGHVAMVRQPEARIWSPLPDITTFELATVMPALIVLASGSWGVYPQDIVDSLPTDARRHFTDGQGNRLALEGSSCG